MAKNFKTVEALAKALAVYFSGAEVVKVYDRTPKGYASKTKSSKVEFKLREGIAFPDKAERKVILDTFGIKYVKAIRNPKNRSEFIQSGGFRFDYKPGYEELLKQLFPKQTKSASKAAVVAESNPFDKFVK